MKHKYGFHVNRTGADVLDAVRRIKPRVVKVLDHNVDFCREVRAIVPDVLLIGRLVVTPQEQDRFDQDPAGTGRAFAERILGLEANRVTVGGRKLVDAWESYNEVMAGNASDERKKRYDDFQVAFAGPIKAAGYQPIAMNFATGNMLASDFLTHFRGTLETHEYLGFHEYDWPAMWRLHEKNIREKNEGGMWLALRYRRIMEEVRQHYPGRHRVLITECGMTQGVVGGQDVGPWHAPTVPPDKVREVVQDSGVEVEPRVSEDDYWRSLVWYNGELLKDDYVQAALLFVVGAISPWDSFEHLGGIMDRLAAFEPQAPAQPVRPPTPAEPVRPPTPIEPVQPPTPPEPLQPPTPTEPDIPPTPGPSLGEALWAAGARARVIEFNRRAALQKRIFADGFVPTSPEFEVDQGGIAYVGQQAEHLDSGAVRVYYVKKGDWDNVARLRRDEDGQFWAV